MNATSFSHPAHSLRRKFRHPALLLAGLVAILHPAASEAATRTWLNTSGGLWNDGANWSGGFVPGAGDTAIINANGTYSVTLNGSADFDSLTLGGGTGTQTLLWIAGSMNGNLTITASGVLNFGGDNSKLFTGSITNSGLIVWPASGPNAVYFNSSHIQNQPGGVIDLQKDAAFTANISPNSFHNAGTLRKSAGAGLGSVSAGLAFTNASLVDVQSGTLFFPGGFTSTSTFNVGAGAAIELQNGTFNFQPGHTFTGNGFYGVASGGPIINGPIINTNFMLTGGSLTISNQLSGVLKWVAGSLAGELTVASSGVLDLGGDNSKVFTGGSITNYGLIRWPASGPNAWYFNTAHIQNQPGGVIDLQKDAAFTANISPNFFHNAGTLRKSAGAGLGSVGANLNFTNASLVDVQSGTLFFPGGFTSTSTFNVGAGAAIELQNGIFNFQPGHTFTGNGFYGVASGGPIINGPIINTNFMLTGGSLTISNQLSGVLKWVAGSLNGELTVASSGVLDFGGDNSKVFTGGAITNFGLIRWPASGPNAWYFNTARIQNQPGGVIDLQKDGAFSSNISPNSFHNAGTLRKSAGAGLGSVGANLNFTNASLVDVQSGTLFFPGGFTSTSTFNVGAGAAIELQNGTFNFQPGHTFTGNGFYGVASGGPIINGPIINTNFMLTGGSLTISNQLSGVLNWVAGSLNGELTVVPGGVLDFGGDNSKVFTGGAITNFGLIRWPASGPNAWYFNTAHIQNQPGGVIDLQKDAAFTANIGPNSFHNAGTLRKSAGAGLGSVGANLNFTNASLVDVQSGTLFFPGGFTSTSTFNVGAGAAIELQNGTFNLQPGHTFTGNGFYGVASGGPIINGPIINTNFMLVGGTLTISNQLSGVLNWVAGSLNGELTVVPGGVLDFGGDNSKTFTGGAITNFGLIRWPASGPNAWYFNTARIQNQPGGVIDVQKDGSFSLNISPAGFYNAGILRKSAGTGTSQVTMGFTNTGTIQAYSGLLDFPSGYAMTGGTVTYGIGDAVNFGRINITGNAPLTGSLGAVLLNGFQPATNTLFTVMSFASSSGFFADTSGLFVGNGRYFEPVYAATSLSLLTFGTNDVTITAQPQSRTVIATSNATFSVTATGTPPLVYQWRFGGNPIPNSNTNLLTVPNAQPANGGDYDVIVTSATGSATSTVATLTVYVRPGLNQPAMSQTVASGRSATFTVDASGVPAPGFQWLLNGVPIPGANGASYTVPSANSTNAGIYSVVISNAAGSITNTASLALVDLKLFAGVVIDGPLGSQYRVDFTTDVNTPSTNWIVLTNLALPSRPYIYFDVDSPGSPRRFYRAVPLE